MFYFVQFVNNDIIRIILLVSLATLLFYTLGTIVQNFFHFRTRNNNFAIPLGIIIYFLITFVFYTPFIYFHFYNWENLFIYLYLIKQFIFTFIVLIFLNSLFAKWNIPSWKQIGNFFISIILIGLLLWLFHYFLTSPLYGNSPLILKPDEKLHYQSMINELGIIIKIDNNINSYLPIFTWFVPFVTISFLYWGTKLLFENIVSSISILFSSTFTLIVITLFSFFIAESLIFVIIPLIYLYFVLIFLYAKETFGDNKIIFFAIYTLASIFTISSAGIVFLILFGIPTIGYLFMRAKSTISLFLLFFTLFIIQLFFTVQLFYFNIIKNIIYGFIFFVVAIIVLIPMYALLNSTKVNDLIQIEKTIKKNANYVLYLSVGIVILFSLLLGWKSDNSVFLIIDRGFTEATFPIVTIILISLCSLYFLFSLYICFFKKQKSNNLLLFTSLIIVIGFNPLTLPLFRYIQLLSTNINIFLIYYFVFGICIFLNLFKYVQDILDHYHFFIIGRAFLVNKIFSKLKINNFVYLFRLKNK